MKKKLTWLGSTIIFFSLLLNCHEKKRNDSVAVEAQKQNIPASITEKSDQEQPEESFKMRLWQQGIDFYARGNEPFWSVDVDFDNELAFKLMDEPSFELSEYTLDEAQDANIMRIASQGESVELFLTVSGDPCVDNMSGEEFRNMVNVQVKLKDEADFRSMNGCGQFVPDYRLNDIWILTIVNGEQLKADRFPEKGAPNVEFHAEEGTVAGHAGCNNFNGGFFRAGFDVLHFEPFAMTRMMCPDMEIEDLFTHAVAGRRMKYNIDGMKLTLSGFDGTVLMFQKAD